jgi:hypothetical protein
VQQNLAWCGADVAYVAGLWRAFLNTKDENSSFHPIILRRSSILITTQQKAMQTKTCLDLDIVPSTNRCHAIGAMDLGLRSVAQLQPLVADTSRW